MTEAKSAKARYKTTNLADYNAALMKARGSQTIWLNKDMQWYVSASGKRGSQRVLSDAAFEFCLSINCLFGLPLRQNLLQLANLDWRVPDFSMLCRRQMHLQVKLPYQRSTTGIKFLAKASGNAKSTEQSTADSGAKSVWALMRRLWTFGP